MKRLFLVAGMALMVLPWLAGAKAQADVIHWAASGSPLEPNLNVGTAAIWAQNGANAVIYLNHGNTTSGTNSGSVVLVEVHAEDFTDNNLTQKNFGGPSANYSLSLALHDDASGASGSLTFRGNLSGFINKPFPGSVDLKNTFLGPTSQTLTLGKNLYTVTIGPFVPPPPVGTPPFGDGSPGSISASIAVQSSANATPEPSSLVLACLGLPSLGLARWLRRRKGVDRTACNA